MSTPPRPKKTGDMKQFEFRSLPKLTERTGNSISFYTHVRLKSVMNTKRDKNKKSASTFSV